MLNKFRIFTGTAMKQNTKRIIHMKNNLSTVCLIIILQFFAFSGINAQNTFLSFEVEDEQFLFDTENGLYILTFYNPEILEVSFVPAGEDKSNWQESHAVVLTAQPPSVDVRETDYEISISSPGIRAAFDKEHASFSFYHGERLLFREHNGFALNADYEDTDEDDRGFRVDFRISETELLMGGGARALGMNRRGNRLELYNRAHYGYQTYSDLMNYTLPMILSSNRYAIHFDNPTTGFLDLDSRNDQTIAFEAYSGRKTYQVIAAEHWEDIVGNYSRLTGLQPLPPLWALGNFSSRFGYRSQEEVMETIALFRELDVPVDAVIIDLYWFGQEIKGTMGNLAFDEEMWPEPEKMVQELEADGVKTVLITEPFVLTTSDRWDESVEAGALAVDSLGNPATYDFYFGNTGLIDVFKPEGYNWFWGIYQELIETYGIHGWWGDLGEPEVHPDWVLHHTGSAREVHNIYGHQWAGLVHDGYMEHYPDVRPFNLMRAAYSGSQRFGIIPWTGDVDRSWGGLKPQPEISLQMGLQGIAYMHSDLGGFAFPNVDAELYVRWMQYGVFQPVYRPHAQDDVPSEPVFWDEETINLSRKAIELRYRLLPYIYTAAFQNNQTGIPLMRPLFFEEPDNHKYYHISETYLFGDDLLVTPVLRKDEKTVTSHMPSTANWYDFYTGEKYKGGEVYHIKTQTSRIPVFVRAGAFVPMADLVQSTDDYSVEHITLRYFYDPGVTDYSTSIYNDDGWTREAFERGMYEKLHISADNLTGENLITIRFEVETGTDYAPVFSEITLEVMNVPQRPKVISQNGESLSFDYHEATGRLKVERFGLDSDTDVLRIEF